MSRIKDLTLDDLEQLIEQKMLEFFGDPDSGLVLRSKFRKELERRMKNPHGETAHQEVEHSFD